MTVLLWERDEEILALELMYNLDGKTAHKTDQQVWECSAVLRSLPIHRASLRTPEFRSPSAVALRVQALRGVVYGRGLKKSTPADRAVYKEFGRDLDRLSEQASQIRATANEDVYSEFLESDIDTLMFEGGERIRVHLARDRNPDVRHRLLRSREGRGLVCDLCSESHSHLDRSLREAIFEVHHLTPFSMKAERETTLDQLALLCANCHRLTHRAITITKRSLSLDELRALVKSRTVGLGSVTCDSPTTPP